MICANLLDLLLQALNLFAHRVFGAHFVVRFPYLDAVWVFERHHGFPTPGAHFLDALQGQRLADHDHGDQRPDRQQDQAKKTFLPDTIGARIRQPAAQGHGQTHREIKQDVVHGYPQMTPAATAVMMIARTIKIAS